MNSKDLDKRYQVFHSFSQTEYDSAWQLENALLKHTSSSMKRELLEHHLEEMNHGKWFYQLAETYKQESSKKKAVGRRLDLFRNDLKTFYSDCYVGEIMATKQFENLRKRFSEEKVENLINRILEDESGHDSLMEAALSKLGLSETDIERLEKRAKYRFFKRYYMYLGKKVASHISSLILGICYFLIGPFVFLQIKRRIK